MLGLRWPCSWIVVVNVIVAWWIVSWVIMRVVVTISETYVGAGMAVLLVIIAIPRMWFFLGWAGKTDSANRYKRHEYNQLFYMDIFHF